MTTIHLQICSTALQAVKAFYDLMTSDKARDYAKVITGASDGHVSWALVQGPAYPYVSGPSVVTSDDYRRLAGELSKAAVPADADWFEQNVPTWVDPTFAQFLPIALPGINVEAALKHIAE